MAISWRLGRVPAVFLVALALLPARADADITSVVAALTVGGTNFGYFTQVESLGSKSDVKTRPNGSVKVGAVLWSPVVLKRAVTSAQDLWAWRQEVIDDGADSARRAVTITLFDQTLTPIASWQLQAAWPSSLAIEVESGVAFEIVEIAHDGVLRQ